MCFEKDFKAEYNKTLFGCVQQLPMEEVKKLLLSGKSIKEVAFDSGYEHPHYFPRLSGNGFIARHRASGNSWQLGIMAD